MATQKGRNWSSGDIVTAANLSSIERGVSEVAEEYTPTTWANGNTVTAAGLNNIEQGLVNAGSGDLSIAYMTLVHYNPENDGQFLAPAINSKDSVSVVEACYFGQQTSDGYVVPIILYKGVALISSDFNEEPTLSGNISYNSELESLTMTGDCTLTFQAAIVQ